MWWSYFPEGLRSMGTLPFERTTIVVIVSRHRHQLWSLSVVIVAICHGWRSWSLPYRQSCSVPSVKVGGHGRCHGIGSRCRCRPCCQGSRSCEHPHRCHQGRTSSSSSTQSVRRGQADGHAAVIFKVGSGLVVTEQVKSMDSQGTAGVCLGPMHSGGGYPQPLWSRLSVGPVGVIASSAGQSGWV